MGRRVGTALAGTIWLVGCGGPSTGSVEPEPPRFPGVTLRVAAVVPAGLAPGTVLEPIGAQQAEWAATRGAQVQLKTDAGVPPDAAARTSDLLVFPADELGDLMAASALAPWPLETLKPPAAVPPDPAAEAEEGEEPPPPPEDPLAFSGLLPEVRDRVVRHGGQVVALPIGASSLVLVYRRDALESATNQAAAQEAGIELAPPDTYEQLDALVRFLHGRDWDGDGEPEAGIAFAQGEDAEGVAGTVLLARAAALGQHPDYYGLFFDERTMEPRIGTPPFVEALAALQALKASAPKELENADAAAARTAFREGRAAFLIDRAERAPSWSDPKRPVATGVAPLPGSARLFDPRRAEWETLRRPNRPTFLLGGGGWLLGVSAACTEPEAARDFAKFLAGPETSGRIAADRDFPLLPVRTALLGADRLDARLDIRGWGRAVARTLSGGRLVFGPRLPEAEAYMADLERARLDAIAKGTPPETALAAAVEAWEKRTDRLGRDRQRWHYRKSLSLPVSGPEPAAPKAP